MSSQIQELIDKIKNDGIQTAQTQAQEIEKQAQAKAQKIVQEAQQKADTMLAQVKTEIKKTQESAQKSLQQASRDTLLSLRKEIEKTLQRLVLAEVSHALTNERLAEILTEVITRTLDGKEGGGVQVEVSAKDLKNLSEGFISKLQKKIKSEIKLQSSDDIGGGFTISYDQGKSSFDFTDESLAQYLTTFLNDQLAAIITKSA